MKATTTMTKVLSNEGVKLHKKECCVCYERFINISCDKLCDLYEKLVEEEEKYNIDWETLCLCYDDRFECLTCKNLVCYGCIKKIPDTDYIKRVDIFNYNNYNYFQDNMNETSKITCPICRTKNFKLKILDIFNYNNYFQDNMNETSKITCPICRTKIFKLKIQ
jgi:hypothetical protein